MRVTIMKKMKRKKKIPYDSGQQTFSVKGKTKNILGFADHIVSPGTPHLSPQKAVDNM